jgi:hypothetical protein
VALVPHYLPEWALWSQLGATAIFAAAATVGALYFGYWQQLVAREKLDHDLYEKRMRIYTALWELRKESRFVTDLDRIYQLAIDLNKYAIQAPFLYDASLGRPFMFSR